MREPREQHRVGLDYLADTTTLLQRVRSAHPTFGSYDAAELQWWWRKSRSTDDLPQLFWFDELDQPVAAVIATDWSDRDSSVYEDTTLVVIVMPDAAPEWLEHVIRRGLAYAAESGIDVVELEVGRTDEVMREVLFASGFEVKEEGTVESWLAAEARPEISPLPDGYRLCNRVETTPGPHHMIGRGGPDVETRLQQTSLYRPDLDLVVLDDGDATAANGLFWFDPVTATGVVEPMRTEDDHQRRGLARHVLTAGVDRLAAAGANRIKIGFQPGNPASSRLYVDVGFEPARRTDVLVGRADAGRSS